MYCIYHEKTASHAATLGILNSHTCKNCDESGAIETLEHLICNCPVLSQARRRYLGAPVLASLGDASSRKPGELLAFCQKHLDPCGHKILLTHLKVQPDNYGSHWPRRDSMRAVRVNLT